MPMSDAIDNTSITDATASNIILTCSFAPCTEEQVTKCRRCSRHYCVMHSNKFSPNFCQDCFKNLAAIEEKFTRVFEDYNTKTQQLITRKESHTKYYMDGMDWPFLGVWIHKLSDDELRAWWVFHFSVMKSIEAENETRKVEKYRKLREQSTQLITGTTKTTTKTIKVTKPVDNADDVRRKLKKQGIPDTLIEQMIKAMNV